VTLKQIADEAIRLATDKGITIETCIVVEREGFTFDGNATRDHLWSDLLANAEPTQTSAGSRAIPMLYTVPFSMVAPR
jgi:hypothetical protein